MASPSPIHDPTLRDRDTRVTTEPALCLVMVGGRWLVGPTIDHADGRRVILAPVYRYEGGVELTPSPEVRGAMNVGLPKQVSPVDGLVSLRSLAVHPEAVVAMTELSDADRKGVEREFAVCESIVAGIRRGQSAVVQAGPRLIVPGRS